jgi:hypothetical protein
MAQGIHFQVEPKKKKKKNGIFFRGLEPMYMIGSIITFQCQGGSPALVQWFTNIIYVKTTCRACKTDDWAPLSNIQITWVCLEVQKLRPTPDVLKLALYFYQGPHSKV